MRSLGWLTVKPLLIEPGSPWENGLVEPFNGKLRDDLLNQEDVCLANEAERRVEPWQVEYNATRAYGAAHGACSCG